ncbi:hypothetical protein B0J18DRAFT_457921 [Chaetomium sp. MPI-SDFR-AT-0129]|nr:hypothetical protein B0J18DRAFT_457921 [Chaetomium sp. MPI-SDFR-AT-0129]
MVRTRGSAKALSVLRLAKPRSSLRVQHPSVLRPQALKAVQINDKIHQVDHWFNISKTIQSLVSRKLHLQPDHPVAITRKIIESVFPEPTFQYHNNFDPVVSTYQNFDSLNIRPNHPSRGPSDTYYLNKYTLLRTHTSAHQADLFRAGVSGYLISADVYRRDEIDRSHYPVFHQTEGARVWDRTKLPPGKSLEDVVREDLEKLPVHNMQVEDPNPPFHAGNPRQSKYHTENEVEVVAAHLKRSLELMVNEIFSKVKAAAAAAAATKTSTKNQPQAEPLRVRWVEAYFPFTSPSWELEVFYQGKWLEVLGCGVIKQSLHINADRPHQIGWAFGIGLERIAMLLFQIPDIRLFWSQDERFLSQFRGVEAAMDKKLRLFVPFSKHPGCSKDVSFWVKKEESAADGDGRVANKGKVDWHPNDLMAAVRDVAKDCVEDVTLVDDFTHPKTGRRSMCYRINYRSLERTLTNAETNRLHQSVIRELVKRLGIEPRL